MDSIKIVTSVSQVNGIDPVEAVLIIFDSKTVGMKAKQRSKYKTIDPKVVPIMTIHVTFFVKGRKSFQVSRTQVPLFLAWAVAIMRSQKCRYAKRQACVALS